MSDEIFENSPRNNLRDLIEINTPRINIIKTPLKHNNNKLHNIRTIINSNESLTKTKDFFMRKTDTNFIKQSLSPIKISRNIPFNKNNFSNLINICKSDIIQIDNSIKKYSKILNYLKQPNKNNNLQIPIYNYSSFNTNFNKKCQEIEKNNNLNISIFFDKILENSQNLEYLLKDFNCKNKEELICRLALEIYYDQLFINKTVDLIFLVNLKYYNEDNKFINNFNETHSKFSQLKILIDELKNNLKLNENNLNNENNTQENEDDIDKSEINEILNFNTISDFLKLQTNNEKIKHLKFLFTQFNDKAYNIFSDFFIDNSNQNIYNKLRKTEDPIDNFILIRKLIEDLFILKENENKILKEKLITLEEENKKLKDQNNKNNLENINLILNKLEEENNKFYQKITNYKNEEKDKMYEEVKNINLKLDELIMINKLLIDDKNNLEKQIEALKGNLKNNKKINYSFNYCNRNKNKITAMDPNESYENLLLEQFSDMKNAFINKLNSINMEFKIYKNNSLKEKDKLKEEINEFKNIKDMFTKQIMYCRKVFESY